MVLGSAMEKIKKFTIAIVASTVLLTTFSFYLYQVIRSPNILVDKPNKKIMILQGTSFKALQDSLYKDGVVKDIVAFSFLARLMKYNQKIIPGCYVLKTNMSNWEAIRLFKSGSRAPANIVLNNVRTNEEIARKLTNNIKASAHAIEVLLNDAALVSQYGFNLETIRTMFIPNTYEVYWAITPQDLMKRMYQEYQRFWNKQRLRKAKALNLTPIEVSILASIVQQETNKIDELPIIAGVYINRLRKGMRLQACPTLKYAMGDFPRRILKKYREIDSPYNTYKHKGLPPGPINVPSIAAIDAVLNLKKHNYLYFTAKEDFSGYHHFATTLQAHLRNAKRYQRALNKIGTYR